MLETVNLKEGEKLQSDVGAREDYNEFVVTVNDEI